MVRDSGASIAATLLLAMAVTAIVYWRNRRSLSVKGSYMTGTLYVFRVVGWGMIVFGGIFAVLSAVMLVGNHRNDNIAGLLMGLAFVGIGYGLQRLMRFLLNDPDLRNMLKSKER